MQQNIGTVDKIIRLLAAAILVALGYLYGIWWLYLLALIPLATAFLGWCGLYSLLKISTKKQ